MREQPAAVRNSILLWLIAVGAGAVETLLHVVQAPAGPVLLQAAVRMLIYAALAALALRLRSGQNWVRIVLTVLLGGIGMLSMVGPPLVSALTGDGIAAPADAWQVAFLLVRALHVIAVVGALVAMFRPSANRFFRAIPA
ncbi:hypothetical protein AB0I53_00980 [Saccharopolyspora sp. NPDC050389]|uniref:hypothetical protein n=1 Tax=Saccharopolyspora sp. NPDC050389 TaxID=3155516 RepID=UPI0033D6C86C